MLLFLKVFFTEFIAEMGDKTQLMLIALTSKYKLRDIISGTAVAILVLNGLAVLAGGLVSEFIPDWLIKMIAALAFLYFAASTLAGDDDEEEEAFDNPTRLDRLKPYLQTPRDMETPFFRAVAGNAPWLFKDRWKKKYTESPVIYAAVVQANSALWRPGDNDYYPAVFVFALDKKHIHDVEWLSQMAEKISELSDSPTVPDDCRKLINTLRDSQSEFCFRIGKSVSGDADAWCATYKFDKQSALPRKALPSDGIVPFLLKANPVENQFVDFKLIPSELYIG